MIPLHFTISKAFFEKKEKKSYHKFISGISYLPNFILCCANRFSHSKFAYLFVFNLQTKYKPFSLAQQSHTCVSEKLPPRRCILFKIEKVGVAPAAPTFDGKEKIENQCISQPMLQHINIHIYVVFFACFSEQKYE